MFIAFPLQDGDDTHEEESEIGDEECNSSGDEAMLPEPPSTEEVSHPAPENPEPAEAIMLSSQEEGEPADDAGFAGDTEVKLDESQEAVFECYGGPCGSAGPEPAPGGETKPIMAGKKQQVFGDDSPRTTERMKHLQKMISAAKKAQTAKTSGLV